MSEKKRTLGKYQIAENIGQGGFGLVFKAYDPMLERFIALKILHPSMARDLEFVGRFKQEAKIAANLAHPNIVPIHEIDTVQGTTFIAMEYVEGKTLEQYIAENGKISANQALAIVEQVAAALDFAHSKGVLHRDVKPSNILLTPEGHVKLADFGLAKATMYSSSFASSSTMLGTLQYISPEMAEGKPLDKRADVYALGVVLYEMLTERVPFTGSTPVSLIRGHADKDPPPPSQFNNQISQAVQGVILKALAKDPNKRYSSAGELAAAFKKAQKKPFRRAKPSAPETSPKGKKKPQKRKRSLTSIIVPLSVVLLLCGGGSVLAWVFGRDQIEAWVFSPPTAVVQGPTVTPVAAVTATSTAVIEATKPAATATEAATSTPTNTPTIAPTDTPVPPTNTPTPTSSPTPLPEGELMSAYQIEVKSGSTESGKGAMVVQFLRGDGEPMEGQGFRVYRQKQDIAGNWVTDGGSIIYRETDSTGICTFNLDPGLYILSSDFVGYNWGDAYDVEGKANVPIEAGKITTVRIMLAQLIVGFRYGDGTPIQDQGIRIYAQRKDLAGNWVTNGSSFIYRETDNTGMIAFNLAPGRYIVSSDFDGYNWGSAYDVEGMANFAVPAEQVTTLIQDLGMLTVGLVDASGNPLRGEGVRVYFQSRDVNNNIIPDSSVRYRETDNSGTVSFDLTPGLYAVQVSDEYTYNVPVEAGSITFGDGKQFTVQP